MAKILPQRKLGQSGLHVSALGLGCMGMSWAYGPADDKESLSVLHRFAERGGNFLDTAEIYGPVRQRKARGPLSQRDTARRARDRDQVRLQDRSRNEAKLRHRQLARKYASRDR